MVGQQKIGSRREVIGIVAALLTLFATVLLGPAQASGAEAPRWVLTAVPTPTNIRANTPSNEVQRLNVSATGGTFELEVLVPSTNKEETTSALPYNATAAEVKAALANLSGMGSSDVSVTGGPGGSAPYEITFQEGAGGIPVAAIRPITGSLTGGTATVSEVNKGARAPQLVLTATNVGGAATDGSTIKLSDVLPAWLVATEITGFDAYGSGYAENGFSFAPLTCSTTPVECTYNNAIDPGDQLVVTVTLAAAAAPPPGEINQAVVSGGGAPEVEVARALEAGSSPPRFGPAPGSVFAAVSSTQAGAHPNVTTMFEMATSETDNSVANPKDVRFDLPPGLVGSTVGMPRCSMSRVLAELGNPTVCPVGAMVGIATVTLGGNGSRGTLVAPVYNIAPSPGEPAAFAFDVVVLPVRLDTSVLSNGNYGVRVTAPDLAESASVLASNITIWGVPAQHSGAGNDRTVYTLFGGASPFGAPNPGQSTTPLLTAPQQCADPLVATMSTDAWAQPGQFKSEEANMGTMTGCGLVPFGSSFTFLPDTLEAGAPAGYTFDLNISQHNEQDTLATASMKNFELKLPAGVVVNPSAAWGLQACSNSQFYGGGHPSQESARLAECPREAQVGEVEVETPDLEKPLRGQVFLATPECDPCSPADAEDGKMVRLFVQLVGEGEAGIVVKLEGQGKLDQKTGQITTVFDNNPQVPFNKLHFVLDGGPRAVLANPRSCGTVRANGDLTPWNTGEGISDSLPFYEFNISQNCFGPQFKPSFTAGMTNIQAGEYGPFTLSFGRSDNDQFLSGISQRMPAGLLGKLTGVELCREPQASTGTCGANSLIGHVQVLTGPGADPFLVSGGQVFLTESYEGAPFGLSIVVPAVAGPYTLSGTTGQGTVVVRAKIQVDTTTAALTVTSDPLPIMLDGIPLQLKAVNVTIDRPSFTFNPTSCAPTAIGGTLSSPEGMSANASNRFQVTNCAGLGFKPGFKVSTSGKTSRKNGASLDVKLTYPKGSLGKAANIAKVKVDLPKQLPSRLTTLQKACTDSVFNQNPAACPAGSRVGEATATTPIIPETLHGPAYFVSHGGAKFPELVIVLSGYGVTVQLHGETFISKAGITSSTFRQVPDVPIGGFELKLPQGANSALAANGNLCTSSLRMPTAFTAQNGMVIHQTTPITATGCAKHKAKHKKKGKK
jgi:hypothetical protein